jgi:hypothetical protein
MIRKILFPLLLIAVSCSSPNPHAKAVKTRPHARHKSVVAKPRSSPWIIKSYSDAQGETTGRKYISFETNGKFSSSTTSDDYLNAVVIVDKVNAGILLHEFKKSGPAEKFVDPVKIKMKNSDGKELNLTSSRGWNKSGGILIERNNNDYSQFRIFMLQSDGIINVEILGDSSSVYHFDIDAAGFGDAFSQI